jgi:drug/metabolite transporter (DMT)-like permease
MASRGASPYLLLTLAPFFWACNWIVGRGFHEEIPPMAMTFFRWFFAVLILAPFAWRHVGRDWPAHPRELARAPVPRRGRRGHAQRPRVPRAQLHDRDQRRHPQLVHPRDDRR